MSRPIESYLICLLISAVVGLLRQKESKAVFIARIIVCPLIAAGIMFMWGKK